MSFGLSGDLNWAEAFVIVSTLYLFFNKRPLIVVNKTEVNVKREENEE